MVPNCGSLSAKKGNPQLEVESGRSAERESSARGGNMMRIGIAVDHSGFELGVNLAASCEDIGPGRCEESYEMTAP